MGYIVKLIRLKKKILMFLLIFLIIISITPIVSANNSKDYAEFKIACTNYDKEFYVIISSNEKDIIIYSHDGIAFARLYHDNYKYLKIYTYQKDDPYYFQWSSDKYNLGYYDNDTYKIIALSIKNYEY